MWRLVVGALRARRGQSAVLFLLAVLAVAASAAAPLYADAAARAARLDEVRAATGADRTVSVRNPRVAATDPRAIDATRESLRAAAQGSGLTDILALDLATALDPGAGSAQITLIAREGICDHLVVTGRCAQEAGEAVVSPASRYRVGDVVSTTDPQLRLSVVGTYRVADVSEPYWAGRLDVDNDPTRADAPVLVTARTLFDARPAVLGVTVDLVALDPAGLAVGPRLTHAVEEIQRATPRGYGVNTGLYGLTGRVEANRRALVSGVVIGTGQLILICVFVLLLAVGHASTERRSEFAVASLRGAPARHRFLLTVGPIAVLLLAAAPIGFGLAWLAARVTAGSGGVAAAGGTPAAYALAGTTVIVALGAAVAGGLRGAPRGRASRGPARRERLSGLELLRRTPGRRRIWRVDVVDLVVMALAAAAAYQLRSGAAAPGGLAAFTPMLVVLACGLVAARLVLPAAAARGTAWLRRGRLAAGLAALHLARRPTAHRLLALVAIAVALLGQAACGLDTAERAARARARLEVGAAQAMVVSAASPAALISAVHAADPDGRWAMAVVRHRVGPQTVVAVEADRLAAVADWPGGPLAPPVAEVVEALRPATNPPVRATGTQLRLDTSGPITPATARLVRADGTSFDAPFTDGRAETPGCTAGCRVAWFDFSASPDEMRLHRLRQANPDRVLVDSATFASAGRWRPGFNAAPGAVTLLHGPDWLGAHSPPPPPPARPSPVRVLLADAPVPLPVVAAGPTFPRSGEIEGGLAAEVGLRSVEVVTTATGLPGVGGDGFMIDNEYASRQADTLPKRTARYEVWLAPSAPQSIVDDLRARLPVTAIETPDQREAALLNRGSGRATRLTLVAALAGLLLAAIAVVVVAAIEREPRRAELRALRTQGLPARVAVASGRLSYAWFVLTGVLAGVLATAASWPAVRAVVPTFVDGWTVTGVPVWPRPAIAVAVLVVTAAALLGVARLASRPLTRTLAAPTQPRLPGQARSEREPAATRRGTR